MAQISMGIRDKDTLLKKGEKLVVLGDPNLFKKVKEVLGE